MHCPGRAAVKDRRKFYHQVPHTHIKYQVCKLVGMSWSKLGRHEILIAADALLHPAYLLPFSNAITGHNFTAC